MTTLSRLLTPARLALVLAAVAVAACGDSSDGPNTSGTRVALFVNDSFVDYDTTDYGSEASNLEFAFKARGFSLTTFSTTDSAQVAAILAVNDVVVFPENEGSYNYSVLPANTFQALKGWATAGGTLVSYYEFNYWNTPLALTLAGGNGGDPGDRYPLDRTAAAGDTPFDGPSTIPANDATTFITQASMPLGSVTVYQGYNGSTDASVAVIPVGSGRLVYFGWDYYDGKPFGLQDGGWYRLMDGLAGF